MGWHGESEDKIRGAVSMAEDGATPRPSESPTTPPVLGLNLTVGVRVEVRVVRR